jgi:Bacterial PH domain
MARVDTVFTAVFAVIVTGWGVLEIIAGAMGWAPSGEAYAAAAGLLASGGFAARSLRRGTWADDAGLRLRGMFRTRVVPWSRVRYIRVRPTGNMWIVEAGLVDGMVKLPGTDGRPDRTRQLAADLTAGNPGEPWLAIGLDLTAAPAAEGSRQTPLLVTEPLRYRANWGLPGMTGTGQTGASLLCSSAWTLAPGDSARAVIIPLTDAHMGEWHLLGQGDRLRLFEGLRICGHAVVRWSESTSLPVSSTNIDRFSTWVNSSDDLPGPA